MKEDRDAPLRALLRARHIPHEDDPDWVAFVPDTPGMPEKPPPEAPQPGDRVHMASGKVYPVLEATEYSPKFNAYAVTLDVLGLPERWVVRSPADDRTWHWQEALGFPKLGRLSEEGR